MFKHWYFVALILLCLLLTTATCFAARLSLQCLNPNSELKFSAKFSWVNDLNGRTQNMRIVISKVFDTKIGTAYMATLLKGNFLNETCEAVCQFKDWSTNSDILPLALDMTCRSAELEFMSVPVTLFKDKNKKPVLRFGAWLTGYQTFPLKVEVDHFKRTTKSDVAIREH